MNPATRPGPGRPEPLGPCERLAVRLPGPAALALLPWLAVLAACGETWWVVLDTLEFGALAATHVLLTHPARSARRTAAGAAVLLCADALADVVTAAPGVALASALVMALCVELPLAAACLLVARAGAPAAQPSTSHQSPVRLAYPQRVVAPSTGSRAPWISGSAGAARVRRYPAGILASRTSWPVTAASSPAIR
ncbi:hypothetical protein GCM10010495_17360 [Kitasatospora herbaricolor]|uniref:hypothetical protein n=1 Tax=Kitasatospora herbaricolor TaxID=68217 RepID=UPI00174D9EE7|nr:hypothetical protein [Kitasatospora herbaricolor]MDQ0308189.1 hypothetical protein [Kitasatospora herbaricolor]GGV05900.1 hypothetical protein GCM10010495_17360 [Kitasatospora herbaricolor]